MEISKIENLFSRLSRVVGFVTFNGDDELWKKDRKDKKIFVVDGGYLNGHVTDSIEYFIPCIFPTISRIDIIFRNKNI